MNKTLTHAFLACFWLLTLCSCNGIMDGIYDVPADDSTIVEGINTTAEPNRYTIYLNATKYDSWIFIDLKNLEINQLPIPTTLTGEWDGRSGWTYQEVHGEKCTFLSSFPVDTQAEPDNWDIAIHHFDVRTNGGSALMTEYTSIDQLPLPSQVAGNFVPDEWTDHQVITDLATMMAYRIGFQNSWVNPVLTTWATMDFSTPPPVYASTGKVYLLKMKDGTMAAIRLLSYLSAKGTKGYLTIDLKIYP